MTNQSQSQSEGLSDLNARIQSDIAYFMSRISPDLRVKLDYSLESLEHFERWLLKRYAHQDFFVGDSEDELVNGAVFYVGETTRKHVGGKWDFNPEKPLAQCCHYSEQLLIKDFYNNAMSLPYEEILYAIRLRFINQPVILKQILEQWIHRIQRDRG